MTIELHVNGKIVKLWNVPYQLGPTPMDDEMMEEKEFKLKYQVLECKVDAGGVIYNDTYQMYAVVKSSMRPDLVDANEYNNFLIQVAKNKQYAHATNFV